MGKHSDRAVAIEEQKPQIGIDLHMIIDTEDGSDITEEQMAKFLYEYLDLVVRYGWGSGGGCQLIDINDDSDVE